MLESELAEDGDAPMLKLAVTDGETDSETEGEGELRGKASLSLSWWRMETLQWSNWQ